MNKTCRNAEILKNADTGLTYVKYYGIVYTSKPHNRHRSKRTEDRRYDSGIFQERTDAGRVTEDCFGETENHDSSRNAGTRRDRIPREQRYILPRIVENPEENTSVSRKPEMRTTFLPGHMQY